MLQEITGDIEHSIILSMQWLKYGSEQLARSGREMVVRHVICRQGSPHTYDIQVHFTMPMQRMSQSAQLLFL